MTLENQIYETATSPNRISHALMLSRTILFPISFYFLIFCVLTYPTILVFSTHLFADQGDGLQNVWNIWWVNKALTQLSQNPWYTSYLHYPYGVSLVAHTLNPFNGFFGILLLKFLTLTESYNVIVIFSFVIGGLTSFLLASHFTKSYFGSIMAGFIFTFSNYHFSHAEGHLQLVSLEWIPLFLLYWYKLITKPRIIVSFVASLLLFLVILCDYYYFFYCFLTGIIIFIWYGIHKKDAGFFLRKKHLLPLLAFSITSLLTTGPLVISLMVLGRKGFFGTHIPEEFSLDLFALLIPGGHWRFASLTQFYWSNLPGNINESSVHIGMSIFGLLIYVWLKRYNFHVRNIQLWYYILIFFAFMSLGPVLHIWGYELSFIKLPYKFLEIIFPPLKFSGVPVRMVVMVTLSASVICGIGFEVLLQGPIRKKILTGFLLILVFIEYLPKPIPTSQISIPEYILVLKNQCDNKGVIDLISSPTLSLYYQTIHQHPLAFGYVSRVPKKVVKKDDELTQVIQNKKYTSLLYDYDIKYLITDATTDVRSEDISIRVIHQDATVKLSALGAESKCGESG